MNRAESELFDSTVVALVWLWSKKVPTAEYNAYKRLIDSFLKKEGKEAFERVKATAFTLGLELRNLPSH